MKKISLIIILYFFSLNLNNLNADHPTVSIACAHPAKFGNAIMKAINKELKIPSELNSIFDKKENMIVLPNNSEEVKNIILRNV